MKSLTYKGLINYYPYLLLCLRTSVVNILGGSRPFLLLIPWTLGWTLSWALGKTLGWALVFTLGPRALVPGPLGLVPGPLCLVPRALSLEWVREGWGSTPPPPLPSSTSKSSTHRQC